MEHINHLDDLGNTLDALLIRASDVNGYFMKNNLFPSNVNEIPKSPETESSEADLGCNPVYGIAYNGSKIFCMWSHGRDMKSGIRGSKMKDFIQKYEHLLVTERFNYLFETPTSSVAKEIVKDIKDLRKAMKDDALIFSDLNGEVFIHIP